MATLQIDNVKKSFGSFPILKEVSIEIEDGDFLVLLGPSGCGKSTLLNLIAGLEEVTGGEIRIGGERVNERPSKDRDIAMVFQSYALYPTMTVRQNIDFGMKVRSVPKAQREAGIARVSALLQIEKLLDRKPGQLSGGQRQRVAMGRALVRDPKLFLFDEPLSNLDAKLRVDMRTEIKKLHQRLKTTIVYVTHDQIEAMTMATKVAVMKEGSVQQLADPETIYDTPASVYVARFVGSPAMNIIPAILRNTPQGAMVRVKVDKENLEEIGPIKLTPETAAKMDGQEVLLGIRPEHFGLANGNGADTLECHVDVIEPTGPDTLAFVTLGGIEVIARLPPKSIEALSTTRLRVNLEKMVVFDTKTELRLI